MLTTILEREGEYCLTFGVRRLNLWSQTEYKKVIHCLHTTFEHNLQNEKNKVNKKENDRAKS